MTTIKKSQNGQKLKPIISGPYSVKKYLKTKNPKSNFNIKEEKTNVEIDTTGYGAGKKTFRGLETSTKPGKSRPVGIKANRDAITDAINKGTNKKAQDGKFMKKMMRPKFNVAGPNTVRDKSGQLQNAVDPELLQSMKKGGNVNKAKNGMWMQKAAASIKKRGTAGKCTPITKPGCTGKAKTLAKTFKKIAKSNKKK